MTAVRIEPGSMLLHYRLVEQLGEGGMGVVWKALDTTLDREVAIKILPRAFASDPDRLSRFEREAKLLASLNHPNVAAVYGLHAAGDLRFLAMELVRGHTLTEEIAKGMSSERVIEVAGAIADGLAAAHRQNVVHRDLKPDNIMIDEEGRAKILDFGLAKLGWGTTSSDAETAVREATTTRAGTIIGTVAYMSPEQAQGKPVDPRSDVFSLGIVLYEMTTGKRPFGGENSISILTSILRDEPRPILEVAPSTPAPLDGIVRRCLQKDPAKRYADASGMRSDLRALRGDLASDPSRSAQPLTKRGKRWLLPAVAAVIVVALLAGWLYQRTTRQRWIDQVGLPQLGAIADRVQGLQEGRESWDAWTLARRIDALDPKNAVVARLRPKFASPVTITSEPPGAEVSVRYYDDPDKPAVVIGRTPLQKVDYPLGFTRVHLHLDGMGDVDDVVWNFGIVGDTFAYRLLPPAELPKEMAYVPAGAFELFIPGLDQLKKEQTAAFLVDRHEVTNREYKAFVDAGAYTDAKYWKQPFVENGVTIPFADAVRRMVDRTGRPGPATWEVGVYPDGQADFPVGGVSWYEAAAYAEWAGKSLPTIFHWNRVAFTVASSRIVPLANLESKGPVAVGTTKSANRYGTADFAGNVREWVWNASGGGGSRFILGGGWNDPDYSFVDAFAQPAFNRTPTNGFRCIRYVEKEANLAALQRPVERLFRDFTKEKPVSDEVYAQYLRQFTYDKGPLDAKVEEVRETPDSIRQKITFNAAYGGERMMAYLFLPKAGKPPYQTIVTFPGSGSIEVRSSADLELGRIDFLVRSGRAVVWPIYKGTYERGGDLHSDYPSPTASYRDYVIMWARDIGRTIDYLETRKDIDSTRLAYYGLSWGGALGAILPAVEPRFKANILYVAGMNFQTALPEADQINYLPRVKQPTLMLNGELDFFFPAETSQKPMFDLLGTPAADKKRLVYAGGHSAPRTEMIKESLAWLDKYLGPVD